MRNPMEMIQRFSRMTGIRDPRVDAWFGNQSLYARHGMDHPSLEKKREPEGRSRSPLVPRPRMRKKSLDEELFEKWMDMNYPEQIFPRHRYSDYVTRWGDSSWWHSRVFGWDKGAVILDADGFRMKTRGVGTITGIKPWDHDAQVQRLEKASQSVLGRTFGPTVGVES